LTLEDYPTIEAPNIMMIGQELGYYNQLDPIEVENKKERLNLLKNSTIN
jgi:hypothetical protein